MEVLARHSARLGPLGTRLEATVREILSHAQGNCGEIAAINLVERWDFFDRKDGVAEYQRVRQRFTEIYEKAGRCVHADREVLKLFTGSDLAYPPQQSNALSSFATNGKPGQFLKLPIAEVRFAHNDQSERFGRGPCIDPSGGSVLQLAAELLAGLTDPSSVPAFSVCWHEGHWFCRSGNRRLAAFRLAHSLAPERFRHINVWATATDDIFVHGAAGRRPKLTTHYNGPNCQGRWILIRETGEAVGAIEPGGPAAFGADLLALLPPRVGHWATAGGA